MPGPRNQRKKKLPQAKKEKKAPETITQSASPLPPSQPALSDSYPPAPIGVTQPSPPPETYDEEQSPSLSPPPLSERHGTPLHIQQLEASAESYVHTPPVYAQPILDPAYTAHEPPIPPSLLKIPFIHDPGDGPRIKDTRAFIASSLAAPPSVDDPLCAEFADEAVPQMLYTVLPEETALILWYNKSRRSARICPACQRLYRLGDVLPDHLADEDQRESGNAHASPYLLKEQEMSGLCSPVCFILAAYNYPGAIRSTWGRMAEELDDATWDLLDGPGQQTNDMGLGMLLKMTRLHDLGLGQLFFPDLELDSDSTCHETEQEMEEEGKGKWKPDGEVPGYQDVAADAATREGVKEVGIEVELGSLRIGETEVVS